MTFSLWVVPAIATVGIIIPTSFALFHFLASVSYWPNPSESQRAREPTDAIHTGQSWGREENGEEETDLKGQMEDVWHR